MRKTLLFVVNFIFSFFFQLFGQQMCTVPKITDTRGLENPYIDCAYPLSAERLELSVTYPTFRRSDQYDMAPQNFEPYIAFNEGKPLYADEDDRFIGKVQLPFNFCYFGNNYNEVVIGTNGVLTFDAAQMGNVNYPNIENPNPNPMLPKSSIFGAFSDLVFSINDDSEIYYSIIGTGHCRKLIINFYKARVIGCSETSTFQIALSEGSNTIEVFIEQKPQLCSDAKFKNSLVGIINSDQSLGYSPPDRNSGVWSAQNEAWIFTPSGGEVIPQVSWYNAAKELIGTGDSVWVRPQANEIYNAVITYPICGSTSFTLEDTSAVTFAPDYPLVQNFTKIYCGTDSLNVNLRDFRSELTPQNPDNLKFSFHRSAADATTGENPVSEQVLVSLNEVYYVRVQQPNDPACFRTTELRLNLITKSLLTDVVEICDTNNDGIERAFQLSVLNSDLFEAPLTGTLQYFKSETDAINKTNEITTADLTENTLLYVNYTTATCSQRFGPIRVKFRPSPKVNSPIDYSLKTCDLRRDYTEPFNFEEVLGPLVTSQPGVIIGFYTTYQQAFAGGTGTLKTVREGIYPVFARVEEPGGCFSIATVNLNISFTKIESRDQTEYICFDGTSDIPVDLDTYARTMLLAVPVGISTSYYRTEADADMMRNPIDSKQVITQDGNLVKETFYVRFSDSTGCYAVKAVQINLVHVVSVEEDFSICDFKNDGEEKVTLASLSRRITGVQNAVVGYFRTQQDAETNTGAISTYALREPAKLFARVTSYGCTGVFEINLKLTPTPVVQTVVKEVRNAVCDNNNDGVEPVDLTALATSIYQGGEPVKIEYYTAYNPANNAVANLIADPKHYVVPRSATVYAKVILPGGCYSVSTITITQNYLPPIVLEPAVLQKCDYEFNLNETFNLPSAIPQLFNQAKNTNPLADHIVTFHRTQAGANAGVPDTLLKSLTTTTDSKVTIWARFTSKVTGCFSVQSVRLETYVPPKGKNSTIAAICDDNLDGLYEVNLMLYTANMVYTPNTDDKFTFYRTKADATAKGAAIADPEKFTFEPSIKRIWVRVENIPGCYDVVQVDLSLGNKVRVNPEPHAIAACDTGNNGEEIVNLTQFEKSIYPAAARFEYYPSATDLTNGTNRISDPARYLFVESATSKKVFVKVRAAGLCPEKTEINLSLKKTPMFKIADHYFCPAGFVDVEPDFSGLEIVSYEWRDPSGKVISRTPRVRQITEEGTYTITVTAQNGCTFSTNFKALKYEVPVITELIPKGHSYTVIAKGNGRILYSIDGISFGPQNTFHELPYGVTTFYVKFADRECLGDTKQGLVLDIKNSFTPNDDGINDTWVIDDLYVFEGKKTNLKIYNRSQQLIYEQESATKLEWNGRTGLRNVPTDSYWYVLTLADGRVFTGWVLLKNRD